LINDSNKIADAFNEHFSNIGPKLADNVDVNQNNRCYLDYYLVKIKTSLFN
jgi:hypothetical protein